MAGTCLRALATATADDTDHFIVGMKTDNFTAMAYPGYEPKSSGVVVGCNRVMSASDSIEMQDRSALLPSTDCFTYSNKKNRKVAFILLSVYKHT